MDKKAIKHAIVKRAPKVALRAYKLWKIYSLPAYQSPSLPPEIFADARVVADRSQLLELLPKNGRVAEIGVEYGRFTKKIIAINQPSEYVGLDIDFSKLDETIKSSATCNLQFIKGSSSETLNQFADEYFDWIYIDGDHSYEGVKSDIEVAKRKVKRGGYLIFNDFAHIVWASFSTFGVHKAATEFILQEKWPLKYWAYESNALYDIVLQRP